MKSEKFIVESNEIKKRYKRRSFLSNERYNPLNFDVVLRQQELERKLVYILRNRFSEYISSLKLIEIGCGSGRNLSKFINLGFDSENLIGIELLEERVMQAKKVLPESVKIIHGNALDIELMNESFDIVFQSTVFTSILDENFREALAEKMWKLVKTNGIILWYDFTFNNPKNKDVKGIPLREIRKLFPSGNVKSWRLTIAAPLSRKAIKFHPLLYNILNIFPFLKTHILCTIEKKI